MLQYSQAEWEENQCTGICSRSTLEHLGLAYHEEWIGRRTPCESNSRDCLIEGVSFEIVGENEWTEDDLRIPDDGIEFFKPQVASVYLETWFDVDKKFGTNINNHPDEWVNLYATLDLKKNLLTMGYIINTSNSDIEYAYTPTTKERELVIRMIRQGMKKKKERRQI